MSELNSLLRAEGAISNRIFIFSSTEPIFKRSQLLFMLHKHLHNFVGEKQKISCLFLAFCLFKMESIFGAFMNSDFFSPNILASINICAIFSGCKRRRGNLHPLFCLAMFHLHQHVHVSTTPTLNLKVLVFISVSPAPSSPSLLFFFPPWSLDNKELKRWRCGGGELSIYTNNRVWKSSSMWRINAQRYGTKLMHALFLFEDLAARCIPNNESFSSRKGSLTSVLLPVISCNVVLVFKCLIN